MENDSAGYLSTRKRIRQPPSVPFIWEERPGIAKNNWKPEAASAAPTLPPIKLVASVPFNWEEKPGKPLFGFHQQPLEPEPHPPLALLCLPPPPAYSQVHSDGRNINDGGSSHCSNEDKGVFDTDLEIFSFETNDSFSLAPSLLNNCLVPSAAISTAVPVQENNQTDNSIGLLEIPSSPDSETDSSTSSYATGASGLVGSSFLECLFPLLPPNSGFLGRLDHTEQSSPTPKYFDRESNSNVVIRRPPTLGELIMISRRRSYMRKAVQMRKQNLSMEIMRKRACECFAFGASIKFTQGIKWKRFQRRMKLL